ncbi:Pectinesterase inhibitor [Cynara cardunculus var. scolymus]|uniref:Pectinesterase inhibitor n=1 Tax=Cynara cardunculus var. scolymus TaxID=59895 RepID=A0A103YDQ3_CYNCS|nr:Pectinesterase inhibitor [Cynara cardunculus var. scolymus]
MHEKGKSMFKFTISLLLKLSVFCLIATNPVSALTENICESASNPEACKKAIERLKKDKEVDPNNTIRKVINFGLQRGLILMANMTHWVRHRNLRANEHAAVKGCLDAIDDGVDDLRKTLKEVDELEDAQKIQNMQDFMFHTHNIKTWLQTAVNSLQSCLDDDFAMPGLEGEVKQDVLKRLPDLIIATRLAVNSRFSLRQLSQPVCTIVAAVVPRETDTTGKDSLICIRRGGASSGLIKLQTIEFVYTVASCGHECSPKVDREVHKVNQTMKLN